MTKDTKTDGMKKKPNRKVVVTCAVTGSVHTPSMSPHLPITPDQIASEAIAAAEAGASILHLHARDPEDGRPSADPALFMQFLPRIKQSTDAVVNISTGGSSLMKLEDRIAAALRAEPEMCSLNMGSMNFGLFPALEKKTDWQHEWEPQLLEATRSSIFQNTFADMENILTRLGQGCGTRFEFECYDVGHLYSLAYFRDRGLVSGHLFIQFVFGVLGGIGPDPENLTHMKRIADKLFGDDYSFSVLAAGRHQMPMITMSAAMGGNVRVGLEDSLYNGRGELARSNADQVKRIRTVLEALSLEIASPAEARDLLGLKGGDRVAF
ncbi:3-keto-5-aminohexanoate cleavage protein [Nitratireductor aquimarinus]|uniref:3-keto-5-aminohexanoate cleavage protein n=1 Tax=Nitratireductor aquimarinus TaxID=889300 RepID=A0ABU4APC7_9HYPH|nr:MULTISPECIES: 3-keto-5-aminohexanoate cleavage protein [Alphaproteobacteria]MBY6020099.1 3-keto-5-aminohexanoate cleavage protein [Nitratireductor sp. DP7N14-4]MBN7755317.1 3-keto-5-aminohexanoate cleavage protein [Nitratireductor aquimarinus]MBN7763125.1 3-keto-5-aminohexanoate cleavage protein [Nitratireductor aquibiodomus]MBN7775811.1 3-keto-5-aminohexanoate cleavage protein [Nitratireductor pacificus]MBN7780474.1 3-keto-5-aminohexanoate cleavage protein [Nitratireductor pacificus]